MGKPAEEKTIMCVECRSTFSQSDLTGAAACPSCGTKGLPADLTRQSAVKLTEHEWRILCIWASNWAGHITDGEGYNSPGCIGSIIREIHRQAPELGGLSMAEDIQSLATTMGSTVKIVKEDGTSTEVKPERKH